MDKVTKENSVVFNCFNMTFYLISSDSFTTLLIATRLGSFLASFFKARFNDHTYSPCRIYGKDVNICV